MVEESRIDSRPNCVMTDDLSHASASSVFAAVAAISVSPSSKTLCRSLQVSWYAIKNRCALSLHDSGVSFEYGLRACASLTTSSTEGSGCMSMSIPSNQAQPSHQCLLELTWQINNERGRTRSPYSHGFRYLLQLLARHFRPSGL